MAAPGVYLSIPMKKTWDVDLIKPLKTFIADTYATEGSSEDYTSALTEFNKLRNNTIAKSVDKHESALEVFYRYYDQLNAVEGKFPISENQIRISFKWQDAFDKESLFSGKRTLSVAAGSYERVCVLFNIAALQSQIAKSQTITSDDGLKLAAKLFQQSSGILAHLKTIVLSSVQSDPTPDLHPDTLNALSAVMLAQGQDCFVRKAMNDKMKPAVVAKLAIQCSDLYADAMKLLQLESIRTLWPKDWLNSVAGKQAAYHSVAEFYQSQMAKDSKEFGEEIARLRHAKDLMLAAEMRGAQTFIFQEMQKRIVRALAEAEKDNDFIYHAKIPEVSALSAIAKAVVAKSTPIWSPLSSHFKDLFENVVPLAVHQSMMACENRKAAIVNNEIGRLREATQLLNSVLASLNLPAAIEDLGGSQVPHSVLEKAASVRQMGGYDYIKRLIDELPLLLQRNKEILDESEKLLAEEEQSDEQLRSQFKERWTRTPSVKLTETIRTEAAKYRTIINNAINADGIVRERFGKQREGIELLSMADTDIQTSLPSSSPAAALQGLPAVVDLRRLIKDVEDVKSKRDKLESEIKEATISETMSSKFMMALAQDGAIDEETISVQQLDAVYSPLRERVSNSIRTQESLLEQIQVANNKFSDAKVQNQAGALREEKLKCLASAYDSFTELKGNLEEGTKFYNDLTEILLKFQNKVTDFCFARKTEKEELMKDLSAGIARQSGVPPPNAPAYQKPTVTTSTTNASQSSGDNPPPRPPPPKFKSAAQVPTSSATPSQPSVAPQSYAPPPQAPHQQPQIPAQYGTGQSAPPYPTSYSSMPYPVYTAPMPGGYNPYYQPYPQHGQQPAAQYPGYPQQQPQYPGYNPQQQPQYPGYNPQQQPQYPGYNPQQQPGYPPR